MEEDGMTNLLDKRVALAVPLARYPELKVGTPGTVRRQTADGTVTVVFDGPRGFTITIDGLRSAMLSIVEE
jgi:hypothetical protein